MPPQTLKTRLCIISDTHTTVPHPSTSSAHPYRYPFPKSDILIHCGDITRVGYLREYETILQFLKTADAELKLVIAGNHDITLHEEFYAGTGKMKHRLGEEDVKAVREMWTGEEARAAGVVYLEEGLGRWTLRSGVVFTVYSSPWQPEFYDWAFTYPRHIDRFNATPPDSEQQTADNPVPAHPAIDIMLTHGPPMGILDETHFGNEHVGCEHLRRAVERCRPRLHCFGHIHEGWGAERMDWGTNNVEMIKQSKEKMLEERFAYIDISKDGGEPLRWGEETFFVNASIMNVHYSPVNAPWIVDLDLPMREKSSRWFEINRQREDTD